MIITLIGADFSKSNIGTLSSWIISRVLGDGAIYDGPSYVTKGMGLNATVTLDEGYEIGSTGISITMGGSALDNSVYTIDGNIITFNITSVTGSVIIKVPTRNINTGGESDGTVIPDEYISYLGTEYFSDVGQRVQLTNNVWKDTHSGTTSAGTVLIPVSSEDLIWIQYVAVVNGTLASGGFYDMNEQLVAPLYWGTFGIDQAANASAKFVTPDKPVTVASVEEAFSCEIAYVKFTAWAAADGNTTGIENTEARIYYAEGAPAEVTYTSYIGEDVFSFNKHGFPSGSFSTSSSSSAWGTDYIPVTPEQSIWLQYIFTMSDAHCCVGLFDSEKTFIKAITAAEFGLEMGDKFKTPSKPVKISDLGVENAAYVKFIAWDTSAGGRANTEARIYD